jgi:hypothetical protein
MQEKARAPKRIHVGLNFTLGAVASIVFAVIVPGKFLTMILSNYAPIWLLKPISTWVPFTGLILGGFAAGAVGAESLKRGIRTSLGFGLGFLIPAMAQPVLLNLLNSLGEKEKTLALITLITAGYGTSFFAAGAVGGAFLKKNFRTVLHVAAGFGIGGICGGLVTSVFFILHGSLHDIRTAPTLIIGWLLPFFIGGSILGGLLRKN